MLWPRNGGLGHSISLKNDQHLLIAHASVCWRSIIGFRWLDLESFLSYFFYSATYLCKNTFCHLSIPYLTPVARRTPPKFPIIMCGLYGATRRFKKFFDRFSHFHTRTQKSAEWLDPKQTFRIRTYGVLTQSEIPKIPNRYRDILKNRQQIPNRLEKIPTCVSKNRYRLEIPTPTHN